MRAKVIVHSQDGPRIAPMACAAAYCPVCTEWKARTMFPLLRQRVVQVMGETGAALHFLLTTPDATSSLDHDLGALAKEIRAAKSSPRWRRHFKTRIGVIMALEISRGHVRLGHPHAHLFAFGGEEGVVLEFFDWMVERWNVRSPGARTPRASMVALGQHDDEWAPRLAYTLKGSDVDPDWEPELLLETVGALGSGKHLISFWGLACGQWVRRGQKGPIKEVVPAA